MRKLLLLLILPLIVGCTSNEKAAEEQKAETTETVETVATDGVEVVYFHGKMKCKTCMAIGELSQQAVSDIADKAVVWKEMDRSTDEGSKFADKYELTGSGLILVSKDKSLNLTDMAFRYALSDTAKFRSELLDALTKMKH